MIIYSFILLTLKAMHINNLFALHTQLYGVSHYYGQFLLSKLISITTKCSGQKKNNIL